MISAILRHRQAKLIEVPTNVIYKASFSTAKNSGSSIKTMSENKERKTEGSQIPKLILISSDLVLTLPCVGRKAFQVSCH